MTLALIETVRVRNGAAPLLGLHLNRLAIGCKALGIPLPKEIPIPAGGPDRVRRLEVGRVGMRVSEREVGPVAPVRLVTSTVAHRPYPHKTTEREAFDRALEEARRQGADEALLLTPDGLVAEASVWGVFWWEGDRPAAPPLELGILPGVARARIAELMGGIVERRVAPGELRGRTIFLANAARGVVEVAEWDGNPVPRSPETERLRARFWP
ncbi:MAG TPA: aminotransferase class IV [Gemmatimonadales bacterium]|nr:aminotransferase class IV [Gemmatimonadales bacterium]